MPPPDDLMERLAAADPLPDAERLGPDEQREADALLERLLRTPVAPEPARWRHRWPRFAAASAIAAVAIFAGLNLIDSDEGPAPHVVARAVAALTQDDVVYHVEAIGRGTASDFPEASKYRPFLESWHTTSGLMHRTTYTTEDGGKGKRLDDFAGRRRPGRLGGPALRWDVHSNTISESGFGRTPGTGAAPGLDPFDPSRGLRELQAEGRLHLRGRVDVDGKQAYRLTFGPEKGSDGSVQRAEFLVDPESYLPLAQRFYTRLENGTIRTLYWRYLTYERLPLNDETRPLLALDPHPGAKCSPDAGEMTGRRVLGFPNPCRGR